MHFTSASTAVVHILLVLLTMGATTAHAQIGNRVPREIFYQAKAAYYGGEYRDAERGFERALKSGTRIGQARWIDSICAYSMLGELYYRGGNLSAALKSHELAINVHLANRGWMGRIRYPQIKPSNDLIQSRIGWGQRATIMGELPDSMSSMEGTTNLATPFEVGGVVNPAHMRAVDAVEVTRCLAVSLRRRAELLGPTAGLATFSAEISNSFAEILPPGGQWVTDWVETLYGLALLGTGRKKEAAAHLATGRITGNFDHPLTGIALLELGKYYLDNADYAQALTQFHQASIAAARYEQADVIEEAFRYMTDAFLANEGRGVLPSIGPAVAYAERQRFYRLSASLRLGAAEVAVYANDPDSAAALLTQARVIMTRRRLLATDLGSRLTYLEALTQFRSGQTRAANTSMQAALSWMQRGSLRRFHLTLADALYRAGRRASISQREAEKLYSIVLREPRDGDWRTEPLETISMMLSGHTTAIERWFELLVDLKEPEKAVRVAEYLRRHRFYSSLPFGGRILSLRWNLEGGPAMLGRAGMQRQAELRDKYPRLAKLSRRSEQIRLILRKENLVIDDVDKRKTQIRLLDELATNSASMENIIREISLRREPAPLVFPPQPSLKAIQAGMQKNQAVLMLVTTGKGWHAWFIRKDMEEYWPIRKPSLVRRSMSGLLKSIGNRGKNTALDLEDLDDSWKQPAKAVWKSLIGKLPSNGWDGLEELVIVPDGVLWYLPFEVLQIPAEQLEGRDEDASLLSMVRVRYSPVASLSVGDRRGRIAAPKSIVVGGQLYPRESSSFALEMLTKLKEGDPNLEVISRQKPPRTSRYTAGVVDRMIVWNDVDVKSNAPYGWSPAQYDRGQKNSKLADWIAYPWGAPDQILLPGYHTAAEGNLNSRATGQEIFLAACGLMANGTRTALLSRWRTGGKAPAVLVREMIAGLPDSSASEAWQTAVELTRIESIDAKTEPRIRHGNDEIELKAEHPFFWAGYMLLDTGSEPSVNPDADKPADPPKDIANQVGNEAEGNEAGGNEAGGNDAEAPPEVPAPGIQLLENGDVAPEAVLETGPETPTPIFELQDEE